MSNKSTFFDKVPFLQKLKNIKHVELIIMSLFAVVLFVVYISSTPKNKSNIIEQGYNSLELYGEYLEKKLKSVLSDVDGAGNVNVMITFDGRITYEYATEKEEVTTSSSVSGGSNSKTTVTEEIIIVSQNGKETPLVIKEIYPNISGVVVVCDGARNISVKLNIISAVQTLLDINENKIHVMVGNN